VQSFNLESDIQLNCSVSIPLVILIVLCAGASDESLSKQIDRITARGQLSELQLKLESAETQRKRAKIEHERDIESITKDRQVLLPFSDHIQTESKS